MLISLVFLGHNSQKCPSKFDQKIDVICDWFLINFDLQNAGKNHQKSGKSNPRSRFGRNSGRTPFPDLILEASGPHFGGSGTSFWRFNVSMLMIILPPDWFFAPYSEHNIIIVRKGFGMGFRIQITFSCALFACSFSPKGRAPCSCSAGSNKVALSWH